MQPSLNRQITPAEDKGRSEFDRIVAIAKYSNPIPMVKGSNVVFIWFFRSSKASQWQIKTLRRGFKWANYLDQNSKHLEQAYHSQKLLKTLLGNPFFTSSMLKSPEMYEMILGILQGDCDALLSMFRTASTNSVVRALLDVHESVKTVSFSPTAFYFMVLTTEFRNFQKMSEAEYLKVKHARILLEELESMPNNELELVEEKLKPSLYNDNGDIDVILLNVGLNSLFLKVCDRNETVTPSGREKYIIDILINVFLKANLDFGKRGHSKSLDPSQRVRINTDVFPKADGDVIFNIYMKLRVYLSVEHPMIDYLLKNEYAAKE